MGYNIEARYLPLIGSISIFDTELTGNAGGNLISRLLLNYVLLSNVTIANSLSTGLTLKGSVINS